MNTVRTRIGVFGGWLVLAACSANAPPEAARAVVAIRAVLQEDSALGSVRNHAPESMPLAEAVRAYVRGLDSIDFGECPPDFTKAFKRHRDAWHQSIPYFEMHHDLRGELHDLFDEIRRTSADERTRIEHIEKDIWGTWAEVEAAVDRYGGGSN